MSSRNKQFLPSQRPTKSIARLAHLSRRDVFWGTIFQQPNASFGEDIEVMLNLVICRTPKHIGQKGHCLTISFNINNDRARLP